jgi:hypothetical protein
LRRPEDIEAEVALQLAPYLGLYESSISDAFNLLARYIMTMVELSDGTVEGLAKVRLLLATRLQGDLRVVYQTARLGYGLPAMTIASVVQEVAFVMLYVDSDARAKEWEQHQERKMSYPRCGHKAVLEYAFKTWNVPGIVDKFYTAYTELCLAKHANPMLQRAYGSVKDEDGRQLMAYPHFSEQVLRTCRFAIAQATQAVLVAVDALASALDPAGGIGLRQNIKTAHTTLMDLMVKDGLATKRPKAP